MPVTSMRDKTPIGIEASRPSAAKKHVPHEQCFQLLYNYYRDDYIVDGRSQRLQCSFKVNMSSSSDIVAIVEIHRRR